MIIIRGPDDLSRWRAATGALYFHAPRQHGWLGTERPRALHPGRACGSCTVHKIWVVGLERVLPADVAPIREAANLAGAWSAQPVPASPPRSRSQAPCSVVGVCHVLICLQLRLSEDLSVKRLTFRGFL